MNTPPDGGPAFPVPNDVREIDDGTGTIQAGMTLRDWFAANESLTEWDQQGAIPAPLMCEALAGRPAPAHGWACKTKEDWIAMLKWEADWRSALKYIRADSMLKARGLV